MIASIRLKCWWSQNLFIRGSKAKYLTLVLKAISESLKNKVCPLKNRKITTRRELQKMRAKI